MSKQQVAELIDNAARGLLLNDMRVLESATSGLLMQLSDGWNDPVTRNFCFKALLEVGKHLGRKDLMKEASNHFVMTKNALTGTEEPDKIKKISLARLEVVDEAIERESCKFRMISFLCDPQFVDVDDLTWDRRKLTTLSLFEMTERLIDLKDNIETGSRSKSEPLVMAASALVFYVNQGFTDIMEYGLWVRNNAESLLSGRMEVPSDLRTKALCEISDIEKTLPSHEVQKAFDRLSRMSVLATQFHDVTLAGGAGEGGSKTQPRQKRSSSFAL